MATITFHGAAQEVTGSCHLLDSPALGRVLLDCGVRQGGDALGRIQDEGFPFEPGSIDAVILSHVHLDHSGLLPTLVKQGFDGPIYCTDSSRGLLRILLEDASGLYHRDLEHENLRRARSGRPACSCRCSLTVSLPRSFSSLQYTDQVHAVQTPAHRQRTESGGGHRHGRCCQKSLCRYHIGNPEGVSLQARHHQPRQGIGYHEGVYHNNRCVVGTALAWVRWQVREDRLRVQQREEAPHVLHRQ